MAETTTFATGPRPRLCRSEGVGERLAQGSKLFGEVKDDEVKIAITPKDGLATGQGDALPLPSDDRAHGADADLDRLRTRGAFTMVDLQEDRSLVRNLFNLGVDLYVVDWGNPNRADRYVTLEDYDTYLDGCVDVIAQRHDIERINLLGICEGGVFTTCYAALHPEKVQNMVLTITPIDFHADKLSDRPGHGFINVWTRSLDAKDVDRMIDAYGVLPGEFMGSVFSMMTPLRSMTKYNLDLLDVVDDRKKFLNFLRMEKWIADRPHHPGEAAKQRLKDLYQENKLVDGTFELGGRRVDLKNITCPVLNVYATDDHIIPPATSQALGSKVGSSDYSELGLPGGHVGVFVGGKAQALLGSGIADWLGKRD